MRKIYTGIIFSFLIFLFSAVSAGSVYAQYFNLELENPGQSINVNDIFNVKIMINTQGVEAINGDALLQFDSGKISILSAQSENFFTFAFSTFISGSNNKYLASSWEESIAHAKSSSSETPFYTLSVKAVGSGQTQLTFICQSGSEADTNINRSADSADVVNCPLQPLNLNIGSTSGNGPTITPPDTNPTDSGYLSPTPDYGQYPTPTFTPSPTPEPTETPTPTPEPPTETPTPTDLSDLSADEESTISAEDLPRAGVFGLTLGVLSLGTILTAIGVLFML
ncbi:hypothetical protein A3D05_01570 [Candidatus Gottesmanbacteria bacterium RIFCSPHIGHO2_02_FULL_40_24]|uniref:Cohesin domain-containing protein n=1 Tax=Candidatus Gottesmanbacteria bacterium RIFCSPHIGHO2_01_FULL_40_15 TaxID=1798376 RepID=A0A1F5YZ78_9BACT|nr:MAG: hypothetical protein A2777_04475 [Candidatus Gottesmanbacteria bacterium RIFCSPHIGHO2_01_FULL_40_15]OGG16355.1 MAG: hypothetical protein A3D05_01570 [Candidatus Gottesmanbacteria bacterium RIFCSPHIGHO2_02_FULL_40_24]OGG21290.1 MAG: hypothetical protein A3B48_04665 [Candidatus Gottesmanbacteria bacterium RIFCSPLOWO2_01_FULL_40_10]OGG23445.1 MAG: hypothetical protein A3E42_00160 [Candidatus Gottesmanbacteria bacterium RIFCSPHIGHO2_12_FULL_40_13]OGG33043.1 MAG: hypothetical protein A3I80_0